LVKLEQSRGDRTESDTDDKRNGLFAVPVKIRVIFVISITGFWIVYKRYGGFKVHNFLVKIT